MFRNKRMKPQSENGVLAQHRIELDELQAELAAIDLEALEAEATRTRIKEMEYLHDPSRPAFSSAPDSRAIELNGTTSSARAAFDDGSSRKRETERRIRVLKIRLAANDTVIQTRDEIVRVHAERDEAIALLSQHRAAVGNLSAELTTAKEQARNAADAAAEAMLDKHLRGEAIEPDASTDENRRVANLQRMLRAAQAREQGAAQHVRELDQRIPELKAAWRSARLHAAEIALDDAMPAFKAALAEMFAAKMVAGGTYPSEFRIAPPARDVDEARARIEAELPAITVVAMPMAGTDGGPVASEADGEDLKLEREGTND